MRDKKIHNDIYNEILVYNILHSAATEWKFIADDTHKPASSNQEKTKEKTQNE
jgi:hypothetical protein